MRHTVLNLTFVATLVASIVTQAQDVQKSDAVQSTTPPAASQSGSAADLARQLSNPVSSLISVPFQFNYDGSIGPEDAGDKYQLNVQPVIPFSISDGWNMISRTITPIIYQHNVVPDDSEFGLGDITQSLFFSPKTPGKLGIVWGVGPVALIPIATDDQLGSGKFALGPTGIVLKQQGHWTYGALVNHLWSVAGESDRADISSTFMQPFLAYNTTSAWTFNVNLESNYNWNENQWSVPINAQVSKLFHIGKQPISIGGGVRYWAESAEGGPEGFGGRFVITLLFPEKKKR